MKAAFFIAFLFILTNLAAQKVETVYLDYQDSTSNLYIVVYPSKLPYKGYLFLIPGMFQKAADVLVQTNLPKYAAKNFFLGGFSIGGTCAIKYAELALSKKL